MKLAICICGQLRTYLSCIDSLKNVINDDTDIYITTWEEEEKEKEKIISSYKQLGVKNVFVNFLKYNEADFQLPNICDTFARLWWIFYQSMKFIKNSYDIVLKLRPDILILQKINFKPCNKLQFFRTLLQLKDCKHSDNIFFGSYQDMKKFSECFLYLSDLEKKYGNKINNAHIIPFLYCEFKNILWEAKYIEKRYLKFIRDPPVEDQENYYTFNYVNDVSIQNFIIEKTFYGVDRKLNYTDEKVYENRLVNLKQGGMKGVTSCPFPRIITLITGEICLMIYDIRKDSTTIWNLFVVDLDAEDHLLVKIPANCLFGYLAKKDTFCIESDLGICKEDSYILKYDIFSELLKLKWTPLNYIRDETEKSYLEFTGNNIKLLPVPLETLEFNKNHKQGDLEQIKWLKPKNVIYTKNYIPELLEEILFVYGVCLENNIKLVLNVKNIPKFLTDIILQG